MNENIELKKNEILQWIKDLQDEDVINDLILLKAQFHNTVNEPNAEYIIKDNFEERWAKGLTSNQAREETKRRIREWWGK